VSQRQLGTHDKNDLRGGLDDKGRQNERAHPPPKERRVEGTTSGIVIRPNMILVENKSGVGAITGQAYAGIRAWADSEGFMPPHRVWGLSEKEQII
jgi:hypothetical protein